MKSLLNFLSIFILFWLFFAPTVVDAAMSDHFVTTWKTDNAGTSSSTSITIPTTGFGYSYNVDWDNDGVFDQTGLTGSITHDFGTPGTYTIRIEGNFPRIYFNNGGDKEKIVSIDQWGSIVWSDMTNAFYGCSKLVLNATDSPNLSGVTKTTSMFRNATSLDGDVSGWNMSTVQFMASMFLFASSFNGDVSGWDVGSASNMANMFFGASSFDQDLGNWNISSVTSMSNFLQSASLSTNNYDSTLKGWSSLSLNSEIDVDFGSSEYCDANSRSILTNTPNSWTILDGGISESCDSTPPTQSSHSPSSGVTISDSTPLINFNLNEAGDCRVSLFDESYDDMSDDTDCTGDGTTSISCVAPDLGSNGSKNIYLSCQDTSGNKDTSETNTSISYTLDTSAITKIYHIGNSLTRDAQPGTIESELNLLASGQHIACGQSLTSIVDNPDYTCVTPDEPYGKWENALGNYDWDAITIQVYTGSTGTTDLASAVSIIDKATLDGESNMNRNLNTTYWMYLPWPAKDESKILSDLIINTPFIDSSESMTISLGYIYWLQNQLQLEYPSLDIRVIPTGAVMAQLDKELRSSPISGVSIAPEVGDSITTLSSGWNLYRDSDHLNWNSYSDYGRDIASEVMLSSITGGSSLDFDLVEGLSSWSTLVNETINNVLSLESKGLESQSPPIISSIASDVTADSASITWDTDEVSSSQVHYSPISDLISTTLDVSLKSSHSISINNLQSCTKYYYKVVSADPLGNTATSSLNSFDTDGCVGDSSVSDSSEKEISSTGGTINLLSSNKGISLSIPASFKEGSSSAYFQIRKLNKSIFLSSAGRPGGRIEVGDYVYNLKSLENSTSSISSFDNPIEITITYDDSDISSIDESSLNIYRYDGISWNQLLDCNVNKSANTVTCSTSNFSDFVLFGDRSNNSGTIRGGVKFGCKDKNAINYDYFSSHKESLCEYNNYTIGDYEIIELINMLVSMGLIDSNKVDYIDKLIAGSNYNFTKNLQFGDVDEQVIHLQRFLNNNGYLLIKDGPGSPGKETNYFGELTRQAVIKFQEKNNINPAVGYFGPITRSSVNY